MRGAARAVPWALLVVPALMFAGCGTASSRSALELAASVDDASRFEFVDRPDAEGLMECLGTAETLVITVDTEQNALAVRREGASDPIVVWTAAASFIDASLLTPGRGWIRIERDLAEPIRRDVAAAVGESLAGYVFADGLPPSATAVARSALAAAAQMTETRSPTGSVTVDVEVDGIVDAVAGLDGEPIPSLSFTLENGRITNIWARLPSAGEDSFGFVWEYDPLTDVSAVEPPSESTDISLMAESIGTGITGATPCSQGL